MESVNQVTDDFGGTSPLGGRPECHKPSNGWFTIYGIQLNLLMQLHQLVPINLLVLLLLTGFKVVVRSVQHVEYIANSCYHVVATTLLICNDQFCGAFGRSKTRFCKELVLCFIQKTIRIR